jgi:predicted translin family RNA/ssDNA-binding protein
MPTLTLAISKELKSKMDAFPEMNWSEIARKAISEKILEYMLFTSIVKKSKLSQKDALAIGSKVNDSLYQAYKKKYAELMK